MQVEGASVVNTPYLDNITAQINAIKGVDVCVGVQEVLNDAAQVIQAQLDSIRKEMAGLLPLCSAPGSLGAVIAWIKHLVASAATAYAAYVAQIAATLAAVARLQAALASLSTRLVTCNLTLPPIS